MRFGILGPLDIRTEDGSPLDPGGPRPRALLTLLLLDAGRTVSTERLTDGLYGAEPPAGAANALQSQVSRLRKRLGPHAEIEATPTGYRIGVSPDTVDAHRFERLAGEGRTALIRGDHTGAAATLREALALWRGPALTDLPDAHAQVTRLHELRLAAVQDRVDAELALGGGPELVPELRELITAHPLSERLYGQLMRALHASGRPAEALTVYEEVRRTLAEELGADPSPELSALHLELLKGAAPAQRRVPAQLTRFIGRGPELRRIGALLPDARLVTLTGPGGAGKTRLATEVASARTSAAPNTHGNAVDSERANAYADVCFIELTGLTDGSQIPYAILTALGVREGFRTPTTDTTQRLLAALEDRELLLVLDNCEHLVEDAARIAALLLGTCRGVRILATSRESLGITGEVLCPVPPLPPEPAARLFVDRAAAVKPGFEGHARVADICAALDGLPLAIELAAARLRTLTPDELADRLDDRLADRFRLLSRGDRTKAARHRTLRAVVEWSWDLLVDEERELARRLTVFSGGATLDAVEAVCEVPYPEDLLASLAEKSLLEVSDGRYRMLETVRAYAAEHLAEQGEEERLQAAHAAYFLRLAEEAEPHLRSGGQLPWLARLDAEHGNLDAALRHLVRTDTGRALLLMAALSWFWRLRGLHGEQVPLAHELLAAVGDAPPEGLAEEYVLCLINTVSGGADGDDPAAREHLDRAAVLLGSLHHQLRLPFTFVMWSVADGPRRVTDEQVRTQVGDAPWGLALMELGDGFQQLFAGRPDAAEAALTRGLAGFRATGDRWGLANCLDPLAMLADLRGDHERALELIDEALRYVRELAAPEETGDLVQRRATVLLHLGDHDAAAEHYTHAASLARTAGAPDKVAAARRGLGDTARLSGDTARARVHYEDALEACAGNWFSLGESVRIFIGLGRTALAEQRADEARDWFVQAHTLAREVHGGLELADATEALASVAESPERAAVLLGAAVALRGAAAEGDPEIVGIRERIHEALSPEAYEKAFQQGRSLGSAAVSER
ncbi:SARP family transcriptional regulator [Streptomyces albiflavescens]|uniref:SARP family transcriptional regulator n=1 Tax=Streptomyces albiflavescens TaxID=1623582 RepID=A0A917Y7U8_9ACTN|nr:BTAD domain-containing putative transcriptional regulator [Streptomyces albiflavescens]GGN76207.1 SARP family transcriptional regulator [Streptomyces albiflavescens]